ncbi:MAG: 50S ribosomal protein L10 [Bacteroidota bacterium]|nr:50S ribosomal protein L10 [Bacteroidota bacterium]
MTREQKAQTIEVITEQLNKYPHIYLTDTSGLNAEDTTNLRRMCFKKDVSLLVVKNTLLSNAIDKSDKELNEFKTILKQPTAIMFSEVGNAPAKIIKDFRKKEEKPSLKAAYVEESVYVGDEMLDTLAAIKSKEELIGDIIMLLKSPTNKLISQLNSGKHLLAGITETLSKK